MNLPLAYMIQMWPNGSTIWERFWRTCGDLDGARDHCERGLRILGDTLGDDHLDTCTARATFYGIRRKIKKRFLRGGK